jgi:hypothetical protein
MADISVPMSAPSTPGTYMGTWRMRNPSGTFFGDEVWVLINVQGWGPTATPSTYYAIEGYVTGPEGIVNPIEGVTINVSGYGFVATDSTGHYRVDVPAGTYTLTPSKAGYTFSPPSKTVAAGTTPPQINFTGIPISVETYYIDGFVTGPEGIGNPISGVTVEISGYGSVTTGSNGHYRVDGLSGGTYTVTPYHDNYEFLPPSKTVTLGPNADQVNFGPPCALLSH